MNKVLMPILVGALVSATFIHASDDRPAKPDIVLLLTDDLGWQDVKCYNRC